MQLAGTMSWRIGTDEPQSLLLALYMRDVSGLRPLLDREIPPLEPELPFGEAPSATDTIASTQWADWWHQLLEGGGFWPDGKHPPDLSRLTHDTEIQRLFYWPSRHQPPDFVGLSDMPELQVLVRNHFDRARVWMEARHQEFAALSSARQRLLLESEIVRTVERAFGRTANPFALDIRVLPVAGAQAWRLSTGRVLVTRALFRDRDAYRYWLQPIVEELA